MGSAHYPWLPVRLMLYASLAVTFAGFALFWLMNIAVVFQRSADAMLSLFVPFSSNFVVNLKRAD